MSQPVPINPQAIIKPGTMAIATAFMAMISMGWVIPLAYKMNVTAIKIVAFTIMTFIVGAFLLGLTNPSVFFVFLVVSWFAQASTVYKDAMYVLKREKLKSALDRKDMSTIVGDLNADGWTIVPETLRDDVESLPDWRDTASAPIPRPDPETIADKFALTVSNADGDIFEGLTVDTSTEDIKEATDAIFGRTPETPEAEAAVPAPHEDVWTPMPTSPQPEPIVEPIVEAITEPVTEMIPEPEIIESETIPVADNSFTLDPAPELEPFKFDFDFTPPTFDSPLGSPVSETVSPEPVESVIAPIVALSLPTMGALGLVKWLRGIGSRSVMLSQKIAGGSTVIGMRPELEVSDVAFEQTDNRTYLTYLARDPRVGVMKPTAQVSGVFLGGTIPDFSVESRMSFSSVNDFASRFSVQSRDYNINRDLFSDAVKEVVINRPSGEHAIWVSNGWLLIDTFASGLTDATAVTDWEYLNSIVSVLPEGFLAKYGVDFGAGENPAALVERLITPDEQAG